MSRWLFGLCAMLAVAPLYGSSVSVSGVIQCIDIETKGLEWWKYIPYASDSIGEEISPHDSGWFPEISMDLSVYNSLYLSVGGTASISLDMGGYSICIDAIGTRSHIANIDEQAPAHKGMLATWEIDLQHRFCCYSKAYEKTYIGYLIGVDYRSHAFWVKPEYISHDTKELHLYSSEDPIWGIGMGFFNKVKFDRASIEGCVAIYYDVSGCVIRFKRLNNKSSWVLPAVISRQRISHPYSVLSLLLKLTNGWQQSTLVLGVRCSIYVPTTADNANRILDNGGWDVRLRDMAISIGGECEL